MKKWMITWQIDQEGHKKHGFTGRKEVKDFNERRARMVVRRDAAAIIADADVLYKNIKIIAMEQVLTA